MALGRALGLGAGLASLLAACGGSPDDLPPAAGSTAAGSEEDSASSSGEAGVEDSTAEGPTDSGGPAPSRDPEPAPSGDDGGDPSPGLGLPPGPPFEEVAMATGVLVPHYKALGQWGLGIAWRDFDLDGDEDLFVTGGQLPSYLLRNEGGVAFSVVHSEAIDALTDTAGAAWADADNDGWPELVVLGRHRGWLLHNEGGTLVDATEASGLGLESREFGQSAAWADVDGDGVLDLFVAHSTYRGNTLHLGVGDGTFVDASAAFGDAPPLYPLAASFLDHDDDGDLDLYVVHDRRDGNQLWRNDGPGCSGLCMTEVAAALSADTAVEGMGLAVGDIDGDLDLDLFFTDAEHARLLRNDGAAGFVDVTDEAGVGKPAYGWGTLMFDYDGDGNLDIYEGIQFPGIALNPLYRGRGDGTFEDMTYGSGVEAPGESMSVAYADYNGDGAPDLVVGNENEDYRLYRNRRGAQGRRWLALELQGSGPVARDAVGSRVVVETQSGRRLMQEVKIGSGFGSCNTRRLYFGITADPPVDVEVTWPDGEVSHPWPPVEGAPWVIAYPG